MENNTGNAEQPQGLSDYISGQQIIAVPADEAVNLDRLTTPIESGSAELSGNAPEASSQGQVQAGVTPGQESVSADEFLRIQQENEGLRRSHSQSLSALALIAQEAKKREDSLFEQTLAPLTEEEQALARQQRQFEQVQSENEFLRNNEAVRTRQAASIQENVDKGQFAQLVAQQLQLPNDPTVLGILLESGSPAELVMRAQRLQSFYTQTQAQQAQTVATKAAQTNVHAAGGENAPSTPNQKTALHSGNLVDMMRERPYQGEPVNV